MVTNFFRINPRLDRFKIQRLPYSEETFKELRQKFNKQCSFFRNAGYIYISPSKGFTSQIGEYTDIVAEESPAIISSLIKHLVFRTFRQAFPERIPSSFSPLRFFSTKPEHDAVAKFLPDGLKGLISYPRLVEVQTRQVVENGKPLFGLLIGSRQRWQFNVSLRRLVDEKFDLVGRTVLETEDIPGMMGVLAPDETLLGEVVGIRGDDVEIMTNQGVITRHLDSLHLQRTREQIGAYLAFKLGDRKTNAIFASLRDDSKDKGRPHSAFNEALKFAKWFCDANQMPRVYENNDGFSFTVTRNSKFNLDTGPLYRTNLIFDYGPGASETTPFSGLSKYGPFNGARFERNDLRILVLFNPHSRGSVTQFLKLLIDGIPQSTYYRSGLKRLFRLTSVTPVLKEVIGGSAGAYEVAIDEAVRDAETPGFDIALIESQEEWKAAPFGENPYYRARALLMSYGIPTQGVKDDHLRKQSESLQWTLGPIALQMYAKVGGTPWRLASTQSVDREIIVGIGHCLERPNLWSGAEQSKIVGITTFFLGDGSYLLGERLRSVPYADYFDELLKALKAAIINAALEYAWNDHDTVRIVFHIFKPIKYVEADVVAKLVESFKQYKIIFAFVIISTEHPWMMFRNVTFDKDGKANVTLCERGDNIILDPCHCLLQLRGDKDRPNKKHRPPYPVSISIHETSTFKDIKYIAQQIQDFSYLSWRSFYPTETPVTVFYSSLIALESNKLNKIPTWNARFLDQHFRRKQWFL